MDGGIGGWMDRRAGEGLNVLMDGWMERDRWVNGWMMDGWIDGWTDRQVNGWMYLWMDE